METFDQIDQVMGNTEENKEVNVEISDSMRSSDA